MACKEGQFDDGTNLNAQHMIGMTRTYTVIRYTLE